MSFLDSASAARLADDTDTFVPSSPLEVARKTLSSPPKAPVRVDAQTGPSSFALPVFSPAPLPSVIPPPPSTVPAVPAAMPSSPSSAELADGEALARGDAALALPDDEDKLGLFWLEALRLRQQRSLKMRRRPPPDLAQVPYGDFSKVR